MQRHQAGIDNLVLPLTRYLYDILHHPDAWHHLEYGPASLLDLTARLALLRLLTRLLEDGTRGTMVCLTIGARATPSKFHASQSTRYVKAFSALVSMSSEMR